MQSTRTALDDDIKEVEQRLDDMSVSESSRASTSDEEMSKIKNENYHLRLALSEKDDELAKLRQAIHREAYLENLHKVLPTLQDGAQLLPESVEEMPHEGDASAIDSEIATHISGSPYKGTRAKSVRTETSLATTTASKARKKNRFFEEHLLPFLQRSVHAFHVSAIFKRESEEIHELLEAFYESDLENERIFVRLLESLLYLQQQSTVLLNRELHFKQLSQRLEYLFTIFLDPREYNMAPEEHVENLKTNLLDIIIRIFDDKGLKIDGNATPFPSRPRLEDYVEKFQSRETVTDKINKKERKARKIADLEKGINLCTEAMNKAYGGSVGSKEHSDATKSTASMAIESPELPTAANQDRRNTRNTDEMLRNLSRFSNKEKERLKRNKTSLEFIPIGYDEVMLNTKTPQRPLRKTKLDPDSTPRVRQTKDENDPLQVFFQEQSYSNDRPVDANR